MEDVLSVVFWSDKDLSAEVVVRPDGKISLPMLNDVPAAGMTPEQLAARREGRREIRPRPRRDRDRQGDSAAARCTSSAKSPSPGTFPLGSEMNVLQAIAEAGGFLEHANKGDVVIVRNENGTGAPLQVQLQRRRPGQEHRSRTSGCSRATRSSSANAISNQCTKR